MWLLLLKHLCLHCKNSEDADCLRIFCFWSTARQSMHTLLLGTLSDSSQHVISLHHRLATVMSSLRYTETKTHTYCISVLAFQGLRIILAPYLYHLMWQESLDWDFINRPSLAISLVDSIKILESRYLSVSFVKFHLNCFQDIFSNSLDKSDQLKRGGGWVIHRYFTSCVTMT